MFNSRHIKTQKQFLQDEKLLENFWKIFFPQNCQFTMHKNTKINFLQEINFHTIFGQQLFQNVFFPNGIIGVILHCFCYHLFYHVDVIIALLFLNCRCYGFQTVLFTLRRFLPHSPSPHLMHELPQPAFIKAYLGAGTSTSITAGLHSVAGDTDLAQLFV